eukprot:scaffold92513_cov42-Cyclotella_meneghiniana.AAC.1
MYRNSYSSRNNNRYNGESRYRGARDDEGGRNFRERRDYDRRDREDDSGRGRGRGRGRGGGRGRGSNRYQPERRDREERDGNRDNSGDQPSSQVRSNNNDDAARTQNNNRQTDGWGHHDEGKEQETPLEAWTVNGQNNQDLPVADMVAEAEHVDRDRHDKEEKAAEEAAGEDEELLRLVEEPSGSLTTPQTRGGTPAMRTSEGDYFHVNENILENPEMRKIVKDTLANPGAYRISKLAHLPKWERASMRITLMSAMLGVYHQEDERKLLICNDPIHLSLQPLQDQEEVVRKDEAARRFKKAYKLTRSREVDPKLLSPGIGVALQTPGRSVHETTPEVSEIVKLIWKYCDKTYTNDGPKIMQCVREKVKDAQQLKKLALVQGELHRWIQEQPELSGITFRPPVIYNVRDIVEAHHSNQIEAAFSEVEMMEEDTKPSALPDQPIAMAEVVPDEVMASFDEVTEPDILLQRVEPLSKRLAHIRHSGGEMVISRHELPEEDYEELTRGLEVEEIQMDREGAERSPHAILEEMGLMENRTDEEKIEFYIQQVFLEYEAALSQLKNGNETLTLALKPGEMLEAVKCVKLVRITRSTQAKRDSIADIQGEMYTSLFDLTLANGIYFSNFDKEFKKWIEYNDLKESVTVKEKWIVDQDYRERMATVEDLSLPGAMVRYKIETNFSFYKFNGIQREESTIKEEWEKLLSATVTQMKLYTSFPSRLKIAAYVPFATPEQQLEQIMSKLREIRTINLAEEELALDWGTSEWGGSNIRVLTVRTTEEKVDQLQRALTPIPLPCGLNTYTPRKYNPQKEDDLLARADMIHHKERIEYGGMVEFSPISIMFNSEELVQEVVQKMVTKDNSNIFHGVITLHTGGLQFLYDMRDEVEVYEAAKIIENTIKNTPGGGQVRVYFRTPIDIEKISEAAEAFHKATQKEKKETRDQPASLKTGDTTATTITSVSNEASPTGGTKRSRDETSELDQHAQALKQLQL